MYNIVYVKFTPIALIDPLSLESTRCYGQLMKIGVCKSCTQAFWGLNPRPRNKYRFVAEPRVLSGSSSWRHFLKPIFPKPLSSLGR